MAKKEKGMFAFVEEFDKDLEKMEGVGTSSLPPRYWYSTGNYVLNRIISGSYYNGIPQGRITDLAGPSGAGKSFISANLVRAAQEQGAYCLVIDSENALDDDFMTKIGVDVTENYKYVSVTTIPEVTKIVSSFLKKYKDQVGEDEDAPQVLILIDSLDMLMTETEVEHFEKGNTKGDQGQKNKQLKAMLRTFVQAIKQLNVAMVCTSQVYKNQDVMNGEGLWIVSDAVKYACSQIILVQKRKLKDDSKGAKAGDVAGVRIIAEGYKTRFTKPFQKVEIEVPYYEGMDPYSGLMDVAKSVGAIVQHGSWYTLKGSDEKMRAEEILEKHALDVIKILEAETTSFLEAGAEVDTTPESKSMKQRRKDKHDGITEAAAE